jgi:GxxExxY protein
LGRDCLSRFMKNVYVENFDFETFTSLKQVELPVIYKGLETGGKYRIDLIVANEVVVELKSVERLLSVHEAQLLTYLKLTGKRVGLMINFNVPILHRGILRRIL